MNPDHAATNAGDPSNGADLLHAINQSNALIQQAARSQDLLGLLGVIVEQATNLLKGSGGSFYQADPPTQTVHLKICTPFGGQDFTGNVLQYGEGLAGRVVETGQPLAIDDYSVWEGRAKIYEAEQNFRAIICTPVVCKGEIAGALQVIHNVPERKFTQRDLELLTLYANQAGVAIENAHLFQAAALERHHIRLLYDISHDISSSLDPNEILGRAVMLTCTALQGLTASAYLYIAAENRLSLRAMPGPQEADIDELDASLDLRPGKSLAGWVAAQREAVIVPDVLEDERWMHIPAVDQHGRAAICSPILFGGELLGVLTVLHAQPGYFTPEHLSLLVAISQSVGVALSNANRYDETQRRLAEITLIQSLSQAFNQRLEVQQLLEEAANQLLQRLSYAAVAIYLVSGKKLELRAACSRPEIAAPPQATTGIVELAARSGEPAMVRGNADAARSTYAGQAYVELAVPIFIGKTVIGVISIHSERRKQISRDDSETIQLLAGQISAALEKAFLYDQLRRQTQDLEATVTRRTAELAELYGLSQEIGFLYSFPDLLQRLLARLRKALRSDLAAVWLQVDGKSFFFMESRRPVADAAGAEVRSRCAQIVHADNLAAPASTPPIRSDDYDERLAPVRHINSVLGAPLTDGHRVVGALLAADEQVNIFSQENTRLLTTFANQASSAVARLANILNEQQQQWESLVEHLPVGVLLLDPEFHPLVINLLGRELLQVINGAPPVIGEALTQLGELSLQALTERADLLAPIEINIPTPLPRAITTQVRPVRAASGVAAHPWVLMLSDVTEVKENQRRLQSQDRLATVGQLAAGIAHDFNNIMATILVYADLLRFDTSLSGASQEKLAVIRAQIQRASSLIRQILDFSRRSVIEHVTLDLLPLLKEFDKMLMRVLPETIRLEFAYQPGAYWVNGDPTRLQQVLMNLAVNARDAMPQGGRLRYEMSTLATLPAGVRPATEADVSAWIRIVVADTGSGITADVMEHLFEPFYTTKPPGQGTGLGLAQVYGIITQHGGAIDVQTSLGEGTRITIYLPAIQVQKKETGSLNMPAIFDGAGLTVLVAEDDAATRDAILTLLEAAQCYVVPATNGIDALQKFRSATHPIDLIISDVVMPEMGGISLYRAIMETDPKIKMLMITGHPLDENNQQMLEQGNIRWLQKPFSVSEFSRALAGLFRPGE